MQVKSKPFKQIDREYIISSAELKNQLGIKGVIISIGLHQGISPAQERMGETKLSEEWYIKTEEVKENEE